uniref:ABC transmembrane type-1 domain-containing protein n=1 Tax=Meloidogyne floridensis TaxID=298350 RepID=A0A915NPN1_9BILA
MLRYAEGWDWLLLTIGVLTSIFVGAITPASSLIFRGITDVLMEGQHNLENGNLDMDDFSKKITHHTLLYFLLGVITFISSQISMSAFSTLCERQIHRIRQHLFKAILAQEPGCGVEKIKAGMNDKVAICIQAISCCVAGIFYGATMSWQMTLVMLGVSPFLVISFVGSATAASKLVRKEMSAYSAAGAVAEEVLNGIKTVTSFNAQYFEIGRYKKHLDEGRKTGICKGTWIAFFAGIHLLVMFGSMGAAFWYGTWLVLHGTISPGTVFAVFWSVVAGALRIGQALPEIGVIVASKLAAGELFSIIDRTPTIEACNESGMKLANVKGEIEFVDVHFTYPTRPKLPIRDLNIEWLRNNIALVQQEPILFADTVEANIRMGKEDVTAEEVLAQQISGNSSPGFETDENSSDDDIDNNQRKSSYHHPPRAMRNSVASLGSITINNKMIRASERIGRSMTSVNEGNEEEMEELDEVMQELEAKPASVWEILLYARKEVLFIVVGVLLALCRGVSFPVFSIIYGRLFLDLSNSIELQQNTINKTIVNITQEESAEEAALKLNDLHISTIANSIAFLLLGFWGAITTFGSGTLLGIVGERLTQRLRLDVFRNILSQDGYFFDNERHYSGKLCQRLATDAPNVQAAIDQRLAEVLQGIVSVMTGVIVAFYFGWNVAPIGLTTAAILVVAQTSVTNYLKRRGMRDMLLAEDASRIATESIEYVRTVQALNRQRTVYERFRSAAKLPHKLAFIRGIL